MFLPVWSTDGRYLGYVGGTIYLKKSILNVLLGEQYYRDGTHVYVLDRENRVLYHQNNQLIGKTCRASSAIVSARAQQWRSSADGRGYGEAGGLRCGAHHRLDGGGAQTDKRHAGAALRAAAPVLKNSVPFALTLLVAVILARLIALPLWQLARKASQMDTRAFPGKLA